MSGEAKLCFVKIASRVDALLFALMQNAWAKHTECGCQTAGSRETPDSLKCTFDVVWSPIVPPFQGGKLTLLEDKSRLWRTFSLLSDSGIPPTSRLPLVHHGRSTTCVLRRKQTYTRYCTNKRTQFVPSEYVARSSHKARLIKYRNHGVYRQHQPSWPWKYWTHPSHSSRRAVKLPKLSGIWPCSMLEVRSSACSERMLPKSGGIFPARLFSRILSSTMKCKVPSSFGMDPFSWKRGQRI